MEVAAGGQSLGDRPDYASFVWRAAKRHAIANSVPRIARNRPATARAAASVTTTGAEAGAAASSGDTSIVTSARVWSAAHHSSANSDVGSTAITSAVTVGMRLPRFLSRVSEKATTCVPLAPGGVRRACAYTFVK